jgi:hypothetical protein
MWRWQVFAKWKFSNGCNFSCLGGCNPKYIRSMHLKTFHFWKSWRSKVFVATPLWGKCEVATHTPENGTWEFSRTWKSSRTSKNSELDCKGQNTSPWGVLYTVEKVLKCRCPKWPRMSHLDIYNTSYGRKKGRESNCQFDSRPLKVRNWPDPGVCRCSASHRWKALEESYKFVSDLIPIGGLSKKLRMFKVPGVQTGTVLGLTLGVSGKKAIWM